MSIITVNCSYDLNASTAGGFELRGAIVRHHNAEGKFGHGRVAAKITSEISDAILISDLYHYSLAEQTSVQVIKLVSNFMSDRIVTFSIIESFLDLAMVAHMLKTIMGWAAQTAAGTVLSQQKICKRCNSKLIESIGLMLCGSSCFACGPKMFIGNTASRMAKGALSYINRKLGESLSCIIDSTSAKCSTAAQHIPALLAQPQISTAMA